MKTVYKYPLYMGYTSLTVPGGNVKPVKFGVQHGKMYVWIAHEVIGTSTFLEFLVVGTGHSVGPEYNHVDTMFDGEYVWHLFCHQIN